MSSVKLNNTLAQAADGFAAVGSGPRLEVLKTLVKAGPDGLSVGEIQDRLNIPASTLAHHLRFLRDGQLIHQSKHGRTVMNKPNFEFIRELASFLMAECCSDLPNASTDC